MVIFLLYTISPIITHFLFSVIRRENLNNNPRLRNVYLAINGIIIALMIGLRHPTNGSGDTVVYMKNWEKMSNVSFSELGYALDTIDFEKGYLVVVWILSHIFRHPQMLLILSGIFFSFSICNFLKNNCKDLMLGFLVFNCLGLFIFMVQGLRQSIAMCICLFAIEHCKKKRFWSFLASVILAVLFHASAIAFVVVYFFCNFKISIKSFVVYCICAAIVIISLPTIFNVFNELMNDEYQIGDSSESGGVIAILIYAFIIVFSLLTYNKENKSNDYTLFVYMALTGMCMLFMRNMVNSIIERIGTYFLYSQMILVPNALHNVKAKKENVIFKILIVILCLGVAIYKASYSVIIPYRFFWS